MGQTRPARPEPSEIAGRYQVVKKLGAGAFGTVYKAKDKILGRMVAIKTIRLEGLAAAGSSLDELMDRFKREAQVSAQLKHPHIVTIYDIGDSDGMSYLAMEFIDGQGLDRVIASAGRLPLERAALLGSQVADALDFAHKNNVVHRDIKPANIMVEAGDRVKVTDFGIAKVTDSGEHLTVTGSLLGTPSYMSPEQARGTALDGRSDLFAVGCILYEMLAGKKAFRGDSITGLIFKIITEEPPSLREMDIEVPDEMLRIITKALTKAPDGRYQSGRELADDLLALTKAGALPTMRQTELPTAPGVPAVSPPVATPTVHTPPTVHGSPTVQGGGATRVSPAPPVRPPAVAPPPPMPPPAVAAPPRTAPRPAPPPPRSGGRGGLVIGLLAAGFVSVLGAGGVVWYLMRGGQQKVADTRPTGSVTGTGGATVPSPHGGTLPPPEATIPPVSLQEAPPPSVAEAPPARETGPVATQPPVARNTGRTSEGPAPPPATAPPRTQPPSSEFGFLDDESEQVDGREAGEHLAGTYRNKQGTSGSGSFGASGRFRQRERSPRNLAIPERPAVATLRHIMDREEAFHRKEGRYGSFADLVRATGLALDVPVSGSSFTRRGYRFELTVDGDGFQITALPAGPGLRSFMGDDSGFIRPMGE